MNSRTAEPSADSRSLVRRPARDLTAQVFGRLTVLGPAPERKRPHWRCRCRCGAERTVRADHLRSGSTVSCGCFHRDHVAEYAATHGQTRGGAHHPLYKTWELMHRRCSSPKATKWADYGGRGIAVCERWSGPLGFAHFLVDMGDRPEGRTLDRVDNDGGYGPHNCRWATASEQNQNRRADRKP